MVFKNLCEAFDEMWDFITDLPSGLDGFESDFDAAFEELKLLKSPWISVEDNLPEDFLEPESTRRQIKVLAAIKGKNGYTIRSQMRMKNENWYTGEVTWYWKFAHGSTTHWMFLPDPPNKR